MSHKTDTCDAEYVISDCPIVPVPKSLNPSVGWRWYKNPDANLFFPLSSRVCLILNYDQLRKVTTVNKKRVALVNHLMACNCQRVIISNKEDFVWRRENGTTSTSHKELFEFLEQIPVGPPETNLDRKSLWKGILNALPKPLDGLDATGSPRNRNQLLGPILPVTNLKCVPKCVPNMHI